MTRNNQIDPTGLFAELAREQAEDALKTARMVVSVGQATGVDTDALSAAIGELRATVDLCGTSRVQP